MNTTIDTLLEAASEVIRHCQTDQPLSPDFNIFQALEIERREVYLCRLLTKLITPDEHVYGAAFLKHFFDLVLDLPITEEECRSATVVPEQVIQNDRRIDIFICCERYAIPIEAKIDTHDQPKQLLDYSRYCKNAPIYYLTLDGHLPSEDSIADKSGGGRLQSEKLRCISFGQHILSWLNACILTAENTPNLRSVLLQLKQILQENTSEERTHIAMEVSEKILALGSDGFRSAVAIQEGLKAAKIKIMLQFFTRLHSQLAEYHPLPLDEEAIRNYYSGSANTWPGIMIPLPSPKKEWAFALRIEVEDRLYFGVCNYCEESKYKNDHSCKDETQKDRRKYVLDHLSTESSKMDSDAFYWWRYLPCHGGKANDNKILNFRKCEGKYYELLNPKTFDAVLDETLKPIKAFLDTHK